MEKKLVTTSFRNTLEDSEMVFEIPREKERKNLPFGVWTFLFGHFFFSGDVLSTQEYIARI